MRSARRRWRRVRAACWGERAGRWWMQGGAADGHAQSPPTPAASGSGAGAGCCPLPVPRPHCPLARLCPRTPPPNKTHTQGSSRGSRLCGSSRSPSRRRWPTDWTSRRSRWAATLTATGPPVSPGGQGPTARSIRWWWLHSGAALPTRSPGLGPGTLGSLWPAPRAPVLATPTVPPPGCPHRWCSCLTWGVAHMT